MVVQSQSRRRSQRLNEASKAKKERRRGLSHSLMCFYFYDKENFSQRHPTLKWPEASRCTRRTCCETKMMLQLESLEFDFRCKTVSNKSSEWLDNDGHESKLLSRFSDDDQANSKSHFTIDHAHLLRLLQSTE